MTPEEFMARAPSLPGGNTPWAIRMARDIRGVVQRQAAQAPRSLQHHLGPSQLGSQCDRQVVGLFTATPATNHVSDPWPSVVGTAVHAWLAQAFSDDNKRSGIRWVTEQKVAPHPLYPGTADLYDAVEKAVLDHKILGPTTMAKVKSDYGPPQRYVVQLLLYALGYINLGLPVKRVALVAYPRTASSLDGMYVWDHEITAQDITMVQEVLARTALRRQIAEEVLAGRMRIDQVPMHPDDDLCYFCPFYRPAAIRDGMGCPGAVVHEPVR